MRKNESESKAEVEAARERLRRFARPASQATNSHDPERLGRWKRGMQHAPHIASWAEVARDLSLR